ncbi:TetR/AcrR family transcriptional regulator [Acidipropionibacterium virtanenii]|uniref:TetR/AcrR family transcriptional regulator n=1 Tax=Acidipropionibacterium virtanenii TaxID=2057246 RepID=UPI001FEB8542|nr:TetR/AcrR family transcriptional regulator [Acidipropionibacterium virtanenii]
MGSREQLVDAMSDLLWERGYAATSPRAVRERCGIGQGSMYYHFPSKRDLGAAAVEHNCRALLPGTIAILEGPGSPLERLIAYLSRDDHQPLKGCKVGRLTQDPEVVADPALLAPVKVAFAATHGMLAGVISEAITAGELPSGLNADHLADMMSTTIQGGYVLAIAAGDRAPFDNARAGAVDLLRALAPTSPSQDPTVPEGHLT